MTNKSLLPPNATKTEKALVTAMARIEDIEVPISSIMDPWECPAALLPFMAWQMSVDYWSPDWPELIQRQVYAAALKVHRIKGTDGAIIDALASLNIQATIKSWAEYSGTRGTFRVEADLLDRGLSEAENSAIHAVILNAKNTRSHLDKLTVHLTNKDNVPAYGCAICATEETTIKPYSIPVFTHLSGVPIHAVALQSLETVTIYPKGEA